MSNPDAESTPSVRPRSPVALEDCGLAAAAELIGDRWTLLVLRSIFYGVCRFADIKADIGVPGSTLSSRLKQLVSWGLLEELPYREGGARTRSEYHLTTAGEELRIALLAMMSWGDQYLRHDASRLVAVSRTSGEELKLAYVDGDGHEVDRSELDFALRS